MRYDVIVVGAGPAGSTVARELAASGIRVLLLDRARFPRDKPCGGGIIVRAALEAGVDLTPVIERSAYGARVTLRLGSPFERSYPEPLTHMTQRCQLDAYLAQGAAEAGADFRDGLCVREMEFEERLVRVRAGGDVYEAQAVVGADGANGMVGRALGLGAIGEWAVGLEGNLSLGESAMARWERLIGLDLGGNPGGYGWVFPKGDHVNVGVGTWRYAASTLRSRLSALCRYHGFDEAALWGLGGHYLPMRRPGAAIVQGPALLVGDAAGLIDPLSGEGIYAAFVSGRLAARTLRRYLAGEIADLGEYQEAVDRELMPDIIISRKLQAVFGRIPGPCVGVMRRSDRFWRVLCRIVRGERTYRDFRRSVGPLGVVLEGWAALARKDSRGPAGRR
jgi:geranylgeranyl reductase family protein